MAPALTKSRYSRQRALILDAVRSLAPHATADRVYEAVHALDPKISLSTVYRNLNELSARSALKRISVPGSRDIYEQNLIPHGHCYCIECSTVFDLDQALVSSFAAAVMDELGFDLLKGDLVIPGVCENCRTKGK